MTKQTRNSTSRATKKTKPVYTPPNSYEVPDEIKKKFLSEGCELRWVRVSLRDGKDDVSNISDRIREGYIFITMAEIPEEFHYMYTTRNVGGRFNELVCVKDLALTKIDIDMAAARRDYYKEMAMNQLVGVERDREENAHKYMPVFDESKSKTVYGTKQASFGATQED